MDWAAIGHVMTWVESKPVDLGSWFDPHLVVYYYPGRTNRKEVEKALTKLVQRDVIVKCGAASKHWYVWKSNIDSALEDE